MAVKELTELERKAVALWATGLTQREVCQRVGIGDKYLRAAIIAHGLDPATPNAPHRWSKEEQLQLEELASQGVPQFEIARRMGRSVESVASKMERLGLLLGESMDDYAPDEDLANAGLAKLIAAGGFPAMLEECIGRDRQGRRKMVCRLPLQWAV